LGEIFHPSAGEKPLIYVLYVAGGEGIERGTVS
jgi:hypothetical protein